MDSFNVFFSEFFFYGVFYDFVDFFFSWHLPGLLVQQMEESPLNVTIAENFPLFDLFDWWHNSPIVDDNDYWFFYTEEVIKKEEEEYYAYTDIYGTLPDESSSLYFNRYLDYDRQKWFEFKRNLRLVKWKDHFKFFGDDEESVQILSLESDELEGLLGLGSDPIIDDGPVSLNKFDSDWRYLTKVYYWDDWNFKVADTLNTFWFFTYDHFTDTYDDVDFPTVFVENLASLIFKSHPFYIDFVDHYRYKYYMSCHHKNQDVSPYFVFLWFLNSIFYLLYYKFSYINPIDIISSFFQLDEFFFFAGVADLYAVPWYQTYFLTGFVGTMIFFEKIFTAFSIFFIVFNFFYRIFFNAFNFFFFFDISFLILFDSPVFCFFFYFFIFFYFLKIIFIFFFKFNIIFFVYIYIFYKYFILKNDQFFFNKIFKFDINYFLFFRNFFQFKKSLRRFLFKNK